MAKHNQTGRSKGGGRFVQLHEYIAHTYAWSRLAPLSKCAWLEINFVYNGTNNGRLGVSARNLAKRLDIGKSSATRAIKDLENWGFLVCVKRSDRLHHKVASEYRLTHLPCDVTREPPTKQFMRTMHPLSEGAES
jgi:hypothetical protein